MYAGIDVVRRVIPTLETTFRADPTPLQVLLLHFDGADNSTQFPDATQRHAVSANGSVFIDTAQSKFGGSSAYFSGTIGVDYLNLDGQKSNDFNLPGDFTVDLWVQLDPAWIGDDRNFFSLTSSSSFTIGVNDIAFGNKFYVFAAGAFQILSTTSAVASTWYHLALVRYLGNWRLYVSGTQEGAVYADAAFYRQVSPNRPNIGSDGIGFGNHFGWIDELRFLNGSAAWTDNFIPPSSPYTVN